MVLPVAIDRKVYAPGEIIPSILTVPYDTWATFPFLRLPPELRNKIYDLIFPEFRVLIIGNHPQKDLPAWKRQDPYYRGSKPRYRLSCRLLANKDTEPTPVPLDMLEVCRKINEEATAFLYGRTTFRFDSLRTITRFLDLAPKIGIANMTSIEVTQACYGEPWYTQDQEWKRRADNKWSLVCTRIGKELVSLQSLALDLTLTTWPLQLKTTASWTRPLMALRGAGLHRVRIVLWHHMFDKKRLMMAAHNLEDIMMTAKGREERDLEEALEAVRELERREAKKAKLPPVRAKKALVIKLPPKPEEQPKGQAKSKNGDESKIKAQAERVYYQTKGLEMYRRIDLKTVGVAFC